MIAYVVRQQSVGGTYRPILASFNHKSDAIRLSDSLAATYPHETLIFPVSAVEVDVVLWTNLYYALEDAPALGNA